jgi:hypothetical protein
VLITAETGRATVEGEEPGTNSRAFSLKTPQLTGQAACSTMQRTGQQDTRAAAEMCAYGM